MTPEKLMSVREINGMFRPCLIASEADDPQRRLWFTLGQSKQGLSLRHKIISSDGSEVRLVATTELRPLSASALACRYSNVSDAQLLVNIAKNERSRAIHVLRRRRDSYVTGQSRADGLRCPNDTRRQRAIKGLPGAQSR